MSASIVFRHPQWRTRLLVWAQTVRGQPYVWGQTDCAALARAALYEMFCRDVVPQVPTWTSKRTALRALRAVGGIDALLRSLGAEVVTLPFVRAGDIIVTAPDDRTEPLGMLVYTDPWCVSATPETGVAWIDRSSLSPDSRVYTLWALTPQRRPRVSARRAKSAK